MNDSAAVRTSNYSKGEDSITGKLKRLPSIMLNRQSDILQAGVVKLKRGMTRANLRGSFLGSGKFKSSMNRETNYDGKSSRYDL